MTAFLSAESSSASKSSRSFDNLSFLPFFGLAVSIADEELVMTRSLDAVVRDFPVAALRSLSARDLGLLAGALSSTFDHRGRKRVVLTFLPQP